MAKEQLKKKRTMQLAVLLFLITTVLYSQAIFNSFIYDDIEQVLENPWIIDLTHLGDIFFSPTWAFANKTGLSNYYRPMMHLGFLIEQHLFGFSPKAFHLINIILHALNSVLLFFVASTLFRLFPGRGAGSTTVQKSQVEEAGVLNATYLAFAAALIFALHPVNTEVVNWVSALPELTFTLFLLAAFHIYISSGARLFTKGRWRLSALSVIFFFLALLSKETAMAFLLFIWGYDFLTLGPSFIKRYRAYVPYILTAIVYMALRTNALGGIANKKMLDIGFYDSAINIFPLLLRYIGKLLWPANLSIVYSHQIFHSLFAPMVIISIVVVTFMILSAIMLRKRVAVSFPVLWVITPLLPVLYLPVISTGGFADRYLYLPSAGFAILVTVVARALYLRLNRPKVMLALFVSLFVIYAALTVERSITWRDPMSLWFDTVKKTPDSSIAHNGLGTAYMEIDKKKKALYHYRESIRLDPGSISTRTNLGGALLETGRLDEAIREYQIALKMNPAASYAYYNYAQALSRSGRTLDAQRAYLRAIELNPGDPDSRNNLANIYMKKNELKRAEALYRESLKIEPENAKALNNLGVIMSIRKDFKKSLSYYRRAIKAAPGYDDAHYNMGITLKEAGNTKKAMEKYQMVLRLNPAHAGANNNLGSMLLEDGDFTGALRYFKLALKSEPENPVYKNNLEIAERLKKSAQKTGSPLH